MKYAALGRALKESYPEALELDEARGRMQAVLWRLGFKPSNTLFGSAVCRDEINRHGIDMLGATWGEHFELAGLAGFPSAGVTGFSSFASHIPDNGNAYILYGPHIGISEEGELGRVWRSGKVKLTPACGALLTFIERITKEPGYIPEDDPLDQEQSGIEHAMLPYKDRILASRRPVWEATEVMFEVIDRHVREIVERVGLRRPTVLQGGVIINTSIGNADYFAPRIAQIANFEGAPGRVHDLMRELATPQG